MTIPANIDVPLFTAQIIRAS